MTHTTHQILIGFSIAVSGIAAIASAMAEQWG